MNALNYLHAASLTIPLAPTVTTLLTLLLFVWSLVFLVRPRPVPAFHVALRLTWAWLALNTLTGLVLLFAGGKVPSAVAAPGSPLTVYGYPPYPARQWEHLMYAFFVIVSLAAMELLLAGRFGAPGKVLRLMPVVTLFLYGVAYMAAYVTVFPGSG